MMLFNLYTAGTRGTRVLLSSHAEFADALAAWQASQSATTRETQGWLIVPVGDADELENLGELSGFNPGYFGPDKPGVYVTRCGDGVSCLGYDYAAKRGDGVADWLAMKGLTGVVPPRTDAPGTPGAWLHYQRAMKAGRRHNEVTGARCPLELTPQLIGLEGQRVEVVDSYGETRRFRVAKSTGWLPCHLEQVGRRQYCDPVGGAPFQSVRVL